jgi:hypothetical protein
MLTQWNARARVLLGYAVFLVLQTDVEHTRAAHRFGVS